MAVSKLNKGFIETIHSNYTDFFTPESGVTVVNCVVRQLDNNVFTLRLNVDLTTPIPAHSSARIGTMDYSYFGKNTIGGMITTIVQNTGISDGDNRLGIILPGSNGSVNLYNTSDIAINRCKNTNGVCFST